MIVSYVTFKRTEDADDEVGVIINQDALIIDANGKVVPKVWNYWHDPWQGCLVIDTTLRAPGR